MYKRVKLISNISIFLVNDRSLEQFSSMRSAIVLYFLAIFCTANANILNILLRQVRNTKRDAESTVQQLERIRDNVIEDVNLMVMKKWLQQLEKYGNYVNPMLEEIRKEVEDAKAKGKNAQPCYDAALNILKNIDYEAQIDARQCQEFAKTSIKNNLSFIDHLVITGGELMEQLDNIFPECNEKNSKLTDNLKLHTCIKNKLGIIKVKVKNFKTNARSTKATVKSASDIVLQQATECLNNVYSTAYTQTTEARSATTRCLNNVLNNAK